MLEQNEHNCDVTIFMATSRCFRKPRPGEADGTDYHFAEREEMQSQIDDGQFVESAEFSGNLYGTRSVSYSTSQHNALKLASDTVSSRFEKPHKPLKSSLKS